MKQYHFLGGKCRLANKTEYHQAELNFLDGLYFCDYIYGVNIRYSMHIDNLIHCPLRPLTDVGIHWMIYQCTEVMGCLDPTENTASYLNVRCSI